MCHMSKAHRTQPSAAPETQGKSWSWAAGRGPPAGIAVRSFYHTPYAQVLPNHWVFEKGVVGAVSVAQSCAMLCEPASPRGEALFRCARPSGVPRGPATSTGSLASQRHPGINVSQLISTCKPLKQCLAAD